MSLSSLRNRQQMKRLAELEGMLLAGELEGAKDDNEHAADNSRLGLAFINKIRFIL